MCTAFELMCTAFELMCTAFELMCTAFELMCTAFELMRTAFELMCTAFAVQQTYDPPSDFISLVFFLSSRRYLGLFYLVSLCHHHEP